MNSLSSYTSLKDLIRSISPSSPIDSSPIDSPTMFRRIDSWREIQIKDPWLQHAAWAYLQPMSSVPDTDDGRWPAGTIHAYIVSKPNLHLHTYNRLRYSPLWNFATPGVSARVYVRVRYIKGSSSGTARSRGKGRGFPRGQGWMSFSKRPRKNTPQCYTKPLDSLKNWNNRFFWVDERVFPTIVDWRTSVPKDEMPSKNTYSSEAVMILNTHRTPIQKQPEAILCLVGLSRKYFLRDEVYPTFLHDNDRDQGEEAVAPEVPPPENVTTTGVAPEAGQAEGIAATGPHVIKERRKRGNDEGDTNAPPKVLRIDHADSRPTQSTHGGKSLATMGLGMGSTHPVSASGGAPVDVSDPDPLSFADPQSRPIADVAPSSKGVAAAGDPKSENTSFTSMDLVDHIAPSGYFSELRHLHNDDFLKQYNVNLVRQVAMGSQLRLRFEQEAKLLKKSVSQIARRDKRIQARENEIKNLKTLLEVETDMKKTAKGKSAKLSKELENLRALFSDLQVSNNCLSQQVSALQAQVIGEEKLKAAFEEFKQYEDNRVEQRCAEMDERLDALSIDFDEELYPHMLTAIAGRRWVIGHGLYLAVMKCGESTELRQVFADVVSAGIAKGMSEGLKYGVEHGKANLSLDAIEAYDPKAESKYIKALHALKDFKYPIVDQLESLNDAPMDVIMASLHPESDTGDDAPQWIRELHPSYSQLKIPVYPEARDPTDPWACKEKILLADAIVANVSRAEKKKKFRVVCRTHGSAPRIMPGPMVFRYPCQPLLHKVSLSCWRMWLHKRKYLRKGPLLGYLGLAPYLLCITETSHSTACGTLNICICNISTDVRDEHCM
nr:transposase (putative), gypsy type [Tanacetum cinerariifolium]